MTQKLFALLLLTIFTLQVACDQACGQEAVPPKQLEEVAPGSQGVVATTSDQRPPATYDLPLAQPTKQRAISEDRTKIVIENPHGTRGVVHFLFETLNLTLRPGERVSIPVDGERPVVRFHRGGEFGTAVYRLMGTHYEFQVTRRQGWELDRVAAAD